MLAQIVLDCCSYEVKTGSKSYEYIECFKSDKFFKRKLSDGREIQKELVLLTQCPNCKHLILRFLWYAAEKTKFEMWDESKIIRGEKADEIFSRKAQDYKLINLPNPFKPGTNKRQSKKIPWVYGKSVNGYTQVPRYLDETENAGLPLETYLKRKRL